MNRTPSPTAVVLGTLLTLLAASCSESRPKPLERDVALVVVSLVNLRVNDIFDIEVPDENVVIDETTGGFVSRIEGRLDCSGGGYVDFESEARSSPQSFENSIELVFVECYEPATDVSDSPILSGVLSLSFGSMGQGEWTGELVLSGSTEGVCEIALGDSEGVFCGLDASELES